MNLQTLRQTPENNPDVTDQLNECLKILKKIFDIDLLGVYLYGSFTVGGLQRYSDIDLLAVTNRPTTFKEKKELTADLIQISGIYMKSTKRPIEMTLVEKRAINPWQYPPLCDFQYGEWLRESFEMGHFEPETNPEMPDLALLITQVLLQSQTLLGIKPEKLLTPVPYQDFIKAMFHDLERLSASLEEDTRNVLLTLARIWSTLETNTIRSKPDAADWVLERLPKIHQPVIQRAKYICIGQEEEYWEDIKNLIKSCADFMLSRIHDQKLVDNGAEPRKKIKLT